MDRPLVVILFFDRPKEHTNVSEWQSFVSAHGRGCGLLVQVSLNSVQRFLRRIGKCNKDKLNQVLKIVE